MVQMAVNGGWIRDLGFPAREWDGYPIGLLHGEQGVSLARPIPPSGTVNLSQVMIGVFDKGSGALCLSETRATLADTGEYLGASRIGLFVLEDCALSIGATYKGVHTGLLGDAGVFSRNNFV